MLPQHERRRGRQSCAQPAPPPSATPTSARRGCPFPRVRARGAEEALLLTSEQLAAASAGLLNCGHDRLPRCLHVIPVLTPLPQRQPGDHSAPPLSPQGCFSRVRVWYPAPHMFQPVPPAPPFPCCTARGGQESSAWGLLSPPSGKTGTGRDAATENKRQHWRFQLLLEKSYTK